MVIHNLQTYFRLLVTIVQTRDCKHYFYLQAIEHFNIKNLTHWLTLQSDPFIFRYIDTLYYSGLQGLRDYLSDEFRRQLNHCITIVDH